MSEPEIPDIEQHNDLDRAARRHRTTQVVRPILAAIILVGAGNLVGYSYQHRDWHTFGVALAMGVLMLALSWLSLFRR